MAGWTDEEKAQVIEKYQAAEPTGVTSPEIVQSLAKEFDKTPNGVRMILTKAEVYVKKDPAVSAAKSTGGTASTRVNKAEAIENLKNAIGALGKEVDESIVDKLTGKAAIYFLSIISETDED